jgi:phosphoglycerate dehydrogenase-like enzyme
MKKFRALLPWDGSNKVFFHRSKFAVLDDYGIELLMPELGVFPAPEEVLIGALQGMDVFFAGSEYVTRAIYEQVPSLKVVQRIGVGYEKVDVAAATDLGVVVARTQDTLSGAVAEHVFALMLAVAGRIPWYDRQVKSGRWLPGIRRDVDGAVLGIIGLGSIGKEVAKRACAFGMRVLAADPVQDDAFARRFDVTYSTLDELLRSADYVALSLSLTESTKGMINAKALSMMKPTAYLINVARGPIVDEEALCQALAEGRLGGYATDVFTNTPPSADDPLFGFDDVVVTPWVAAASKGASARTVSMASEVTGRLLTGQPVPSGCVLNPEVMPTWRGRAVASQPGNDNE